MRDLRIQAPIFNDQATFTHSYSLTFHMSVVEISLFLREVRHFL